MRGGTNRDAVGMIGCRLQCVRVRVRVCASVLDEYQRVLCVLFGANAVSIACQVFEHPEIERLIILEDDLEA